MVYMICSCIGCCMPCVINIITGCSSNHYGKYYSWRGHSSLACISTACRPWCRLHCSVFAREGRSCTWRAQSFNGENGCGWSNSGANSFALCHYFACFSCSWEWIVRGFISGNWCTPCKYSHCHAHISDPLLLWRSTAEIPLDRALWQGSGWLCAVFGRYSDLPFPWPPWRGSFSCSWSCSLGSWHYSCSPCS